MKTIAILGSTGSIGCQTLEVIAASPDQYTVMALAAGSNARLLAEQALLYRPAVVGIADERFAPELRARLRPHGIEVLAGPKAAVTIARAGASLVVTAMVGTVGLEPTIAALTTDATVVLANKEPLVAAGHLVTEYGRHRLIPIDSEHSAIFQCIGEKRQYVDSVWLTGSGGPFRTWDVAAIRAATADQALNHPRWTMGKKITVDSATMMNKGLELIEARWLFDLNWDQLRVVIHPQSIVHSLVEFVDGSVIAQLGPPDMRLPIAVALAHPHRHPQPWPRLQLPGLELTFEPPDMEKFPLLSLATECGRAGGLAPAVMNAANEQAVMMFLQGMINLGQIVDIVTEVVSEHPSCCEPNLSQILDADAWARARANEVAREPRR